MTPAAFSAALALLRWGVGDLAALLGVHRDRVRNWARTDRRYEVPPDVAAWLQRRVAAHEAMMRADPPPGDRR
jgi:hypothetical protein